MDDFAANARVTFRETLTEDLCIIRVQPTDGPVEAFEPGQFATLGLPHEEGHDVALHENAAHEAAASVATPAMAEATRISPAPHRMISRAYSIVSSPRCRRDIELYIALVRQGRFTPRLWQLRVGSPLWLDPHMQGEFTLAPVPPQADLVMVATGTGIAPYISMLRTYTGQTRWRRAVVIHGVRRVADLGYRTELESLAQHHHDVIYLPTVTREPADASWAGNRGRVTALLQPDRFAKLTGWPLDADRAHVMLCGNPEMIDQAAADLQRLGFGTALNAQPGNIHFERYW